MHTLVHIDLSTESISLSDLVNRAPYTLLYFYPKNDTPGCTTEATEFTSMTKQFHKHGIQIVGVSRDPKESHCAFIEKYGLKIPYITDPTCVLHKQFGARGTKKNYGKETVGVIRTTVLLDKQGHIVHSWSNVRTTGHAGAVLTWVQKAIPPHKNGFAE